jgi:hypothetical protein
MKIKLGSLTFEFNQKVFYPNHCKKNLIKILEDILLFHNLIENIDDEEICDRINDITLNLNKNKLDENTRNYLRNQVISYLIKYQWLRKTGWFKIVLKKIKDNEIHDYWFLFYQNFIEIN